MPFSVKEHVDTALDKLEADGIIEKVASSPWASPTVPVRKPNGSIRVCADFSKTINANSDLERYLLPTIEEIRTKLRGGKKFSTLDLSQAYHQLELDDASKVYTTINTHRGLYQYTRLPFGIHSAVSIFQRTMENLLGDIEGCVVYVDDNIITGKNDEEHKKCLEKVLKRLEDAGMCVNPEKIQLMQEKFHLLVMYSMQTALRHHRKKFVQWSNLVLPPLSVSSSHLLGRWITSENSFQILPVCFLHCTAYWRRMFLGNVPRLKTMLSENWKTLCVQQRCLLTTHQTNHWFYKPMPRALV